MLAFIHDDESPTRFVFCIEQLEDLFRSSLREELRAAGVVITAKSRSGPASPDAGEVNTAHDENE